MCKEEKFLIVDPTSERIFSTVGSEISAIKLAWTLAMWTIHCLFKLKWSNGVIKFLFILFNKNEDKLLYSVETHKIHTANVYILVLEYKIQYGYL